MGGKCHCPSCCNRQLFLNHILRGIKLYAMSNLEKLFTMLRQVNGEKVEMRLLYFALNITRISSATGWRIFWVLGAALARPPQYPPQPRRRGRGWPRRGCRSGTATRRSRVWHHWSRAEVRLQVGNGESLRSAADLEDEISPAWRYDAVWTAVRR